jgi:Sensors of blue-light using FAD
MDRVSNLHELVYVSAARDPFSDAQLLALLTDARARNATRGLTGLLVHEQGSFLQLLEGTKESVDLLLVSLRRDPRHYGLVPVYEGPIKARRFPGWSMGIASIPAESARGIPGYDDFFFRPRNAAAPGADMAMRVLDAFRAGRWHASVVR